LGREATKPGSLLHPEDIIKIPYPHNEDKLGGLKVRDFFIHAGVGLPTAQ